MSLHIFETVSVLAIGVQTQTIHQANSFRDIGMKNRIQQSFITRSPDKM